MKNLSAMMTEAHTNFLRLVLASVSPPGTFQDQLDPRNYTARLNQRFSEIVNHWETACKAATSGLSLDRVPRAVLVETIKIAAKLVGLEVTKVAPGTYLELVAETSIGHLEIELTPATCCEDIHADPASAAENLLATLVDLYFARRNLRNPNDREIAAMTEQVHPIIESSAVAVTRFIATKGITPTCLSEATDLMIVNTLQQITPLTFRA